MGRAKSYKELTIGKLPYAPFEREGFTDDRDDGSGHEQGDENEHQDEQAPGCYAADSLEGAAAGLGASELGLDPEGSGLDSGLGSGLDSDLDSDLRESVT